MNLDLACTPYGLSYFWERSIVHGLDLEQRDEELRSAGELDFLIAMYRVYVR